MTTTYRARIVERGNFGDLGPAVRCPKCKGVNGEGVIEKFVCRCKHCGTWFLTEKIDIPPKKMSPVTQKI